MKTALAQRRTHRGTVRGEDSMPEEGRHYEPQVDAKNPTCVGLYGATLKHYTETRGHNHSHLVGTEC